MPNRFIEPWWYPTLVEYAVLFCPLDDLLAILIVPAAIICFLSLRKPLI
jgi:hypothetical protein